MASISEPLIRRPVATTLLSIGLFLLGPTGTPLYPNAHASDGHSFSMSVIADCPGVDASVMTSSVTQPLENRLIAVEGVEQISSATQLGVSNITVEFARGREIDAAERDIGAAIDAYLSTARLSPPPQLRVVRGPNKTIRLDARETK
jgi:multidrug efflux pump